MLKKSIIAGAFTFFLSGSLGGAIALEQFFNPLNVQSKDFLVASVLPQPHQTQAHLNNFNLYEQGNKNFTCRIVKLSVGERYAVSKKVIAEDDSCKIYSTSNTKSLNVLSGNEVTERSQIKYDENHLTHYQLTFQTEKLNKLFEYVDYHDFFVEVVPKNFDSESNLFDMFQPSYRVKEHELKGNTKYVIIKSKDLKLSDDTAESLVPNNFLINGKRGYKITELPNVDDLNEENIKSISDFDNWIDKSKMSDDKYYLLTSPFESPFDLENLIGQELNLSSKDLNNKFTFTGTVVKFLSSDWSRIIYHNIGPFGV